MHHELDVEYLFRVAIHREGNDRAALAAAERICGQSRALDERVLTLIETEGRRAYPGTTGGCLLGHVFESLKTSPYLDEHEKVALHARLTQRYTDFTESIGSGAVPILAEYRKRRW